MERDDTLQTGEGQPGLQSCPIIISAGEPAGVGPDIVLQFACSQQTAQATPWLTLGDPSLFHQRAKQLNLEVEIVETGPEDCAAAISNSTKPIVPVLPISLTTKCHTGQLNADNSHYVIECLTQATHICLKKSGQALVTAPIHKGIINEAGIAFTGHTELLAELTATPQVVMMLTVDQFRVALVTTHLPLREVADAITEARLSKTIEILHQDLQRKFGIITPMIRVCGLNPHAGEQGHLGREEIEIINPVIEKYRKKGFTIQGSYPADTLFTPKYFGNTDLFLAMYHDQGLPVLKHAGFGRAVNITLGLPIIRTSVDHGTAIDLAGTGQVDSSSFIEAIRTANQMATSLRATVEI